MSNQRALAEDKQESAARLVSLLFHPFAVTPLAVVLVLYLDGERLASAVGWATVCAVIFTIPMAVYLLVMVARKHVADADVTIREQRFGVYVFGVIWMLACFALLTVLGAPAVLLRLFIGGLITVVVFALVTRFLTKVSLHTGAMAGATVVAAFYSPAWTLLLALASLLVIWSRLALNRHTLVEIVSGAGISISIFLLTMLMQ